MSRPPRDPESQKNSEWDFLTIRLESELGQKIRERAKNNERSLNGEMTKILRDLFNRTK